MTCPYILEQIERMRRGETLEEERIRSEAEPVEA
jgi:hypothetical protein